MKTLTYLGAAVVACPATIRNSGALTRYICYRAAAVASSNMLPIGWLMEETWRGKSAWQQEEN